MAKINQKHKTVGVSFNPLVRKKASIRARQLGVTFSRYVGLCIEAEMAGKIPALRSLESVQHGVLAEADPMEQARDKRLQADVAVLLQAANVSFVPQTSAGGIETDFLALDPIANTSTAKANDTKNASYADAKDALSDVGAYSETHTVVAIECRYPSPPRCPALLGKAILLQQACDAVLLCVPYLSVFEAELLAVFARQKINIVTPDTLLETLLHTFAQK